MATAIQKTNGTAPGAGTIQRQEFGAQQITHSAETASAAVAAQAKAEVEARFVMALQRPRDFDEVRARLLRECKRPGFAKVARYAKPIGGKKLYGPSIRFVEAALRCMTNIIYPTSIIYEDRERRIIRVSVTDLETNTTVPKDIVIEKTVERRSSEGRFVVAERTNSHGDTVYLVAATEDELLNKEGAIASKAIRTAGLRILPGDLVEEAMQVCIETAHDEAAKDPDAAKKAIVDAFGNIGIPPKELKRYLGHDLDIIVPAELVDLREVYQTIKDGESTWAEALEAKLAEPSESGSAPPPPPPQAQTNAAALVGQVEQAQKAAEGAPPAPTDPLSDIKAALAVAKTPRELLVVMREIAKLPEAIQPTAREAYNARATEIANATA